jgi:predicted AAA+ superfamily ATPase
MKVDDYVPRVVDVELDLLTAELPAVTLDGAKAVGKTETCLRRASTTIMLDDPTVRAVVEADPDRALRSLPPVLLDEWQHLPHLWDRVRRAVDAGAPSASFLLTGSASPARGGGRHSGAGRIVSVRMRPLSLHERRLAPSTVSVAGLLTGSRPDIDGATDVDLEVYVAEILSSGFPAIRKASGQIQRALLDGYLDRIVERDFPQAGHELRNPAALRRWLTAYAAATSTQARYESIRDAASSGQGDPPARTTVQPYVDVLERLWILDRVEAWIPTRARLKRLTNPPTHQLADPALAARLLGVGAGQLLSGEDGAVPFPRDGTLLGALFQALVTLSVRVYAQAAECRVAHLRTKGGAREVDLLVVRDDDRVVAIEVKLSQTVDDHDVRHLRWLRDELGDGLLDAVVVTTGRVAYRRRDGIAVVPAVLLGP